MEDFEEKKEDLRTKRTKKFLSSALIELLRTTPLEKISIQDICEKAMIHRTTFYTHFGDKYDLFEYVLNQTRDRIFARPILEHNYDSLEELYSTLTKTAIDFVEKNKSVLISVLETNTDRLTSDLIYSTMESTIRQLLEKNNPTGIPNHLLSNFLTGGFISLATWWLHNPNKITKQDLLKSINKLISSI